MAQLSQSEVPGSLPPFETEFDVAHLYGSVQHTYPVICWQCVEESEMSGWSAGEEMGALA